MCFFFFRILIFVSCEIGIFFAEVGVDMCSSQCVLKVSFREV